MNAYNSKKHLATDEMLESWAKTYRAYYNDATKCNLAAMQACEEALKEMLKPYYIEEEKNAKE